jgi:hypothetical protein
MIITILLLVLAVLFALFLIWYEPWRQLPVRSDDLHQALEPISVPALMNLIDAGNLEFLRRSLEPKDFRKAQRERNRVLRGYVRRISYNTRLLIAAAESAQRAADPGVVESGRALLQSALATRMRANRALVSLYVGEIFPGFLPDVATAIHTYQSAAARMDSLQSLGPQ